MRGNRQGLVATIEGTARPPGGFVLPWPFKDPPPAATVNGRRSKWRRRELHIPATGHPITIRAGHSASLDYKDRS